MRPILALLLIACAGWGLEVHCVVDRVSDGDTIVVIMADQAEPVKVRLLWIDTPESRDNSHGEAMAEGKAAAEFVRGLLPKGTSVRLWGPKDAGLERDVYGRFLAVVLVGGADDPSVQERVIRAGHSVYWRKYGNAPPDLDAKLLAAQEVAKAAGSGAWGSAVDWMRNKANERTAPGR